MSSSGVISPAPTIDAGVASDIVATSGNVANAQAACAIGQVAGKTTFLAGFSVTASGSTAGAVVDVTIVGPALTLHYAFTFPVGVGVAATPLVVEFVRPIPASGPGIGITVVCPAGGAGNTNAAVSAHGFTQ